MRKRILLSTTLCLLLTTLMAVSIISPAEASIVGTPTWVGPKYDKDDFHGISTTLIAFTTDTNATLYVTVDNPSTTKALNVSAVKVLMDWNINYSSTEASTTSPLVIPKSAYGLTYSYIFKIVFQVPAITVASNLFEHDYWVIVEDVNATTGAQKVNPPPAVYSPTTPDFIVYSADQATAQNTRIEYDRLYTTFSPTSKTALELLKNAGVEYSAAGDSYKAGDFSGAKTHYGAALTLLKSARSTEETYQTSVQENSQAYQEALTKQAEASATKDEALAKYYEGQGSYYNKTGDAAVTQAEAAMIEANATVKMADAQWALAQAASLQSTALNLFGFGFILFGVAAIIWAFKRPKPP